MYKDSEHRFPSKQSRALIFTIMMTLLLAVFFANVEIQIEGAAGWAANLPTWRIESHWLLYILWGGRPMTGYHAWIFSFIAIVFHFPLVFNWQWSWRAEARILSCIMIFWVVEDFLWFIFNPAFGWSKFNPEHIRWHKHWIGIFPQDYWFFISLALILMFLSCKSVRKS